MEQDIITHLQNTFNPTAIILYGSRAVGRERSHSDWDICLLFDADQEMPKNGRLLWREQNIEYSCHQLTVIDIEGRFGIKLQFGRVLHESNDEATKLLQEAKDLYKKPLGWVESQKEHHQLWMLGRLDGMRDTVDEPLVFERYASDFYARITNYWYLSLHDTNPKPIDLALEEIADKDTEYFALLEEFVHGSREQKIKAAEGIYQRCFLNV